MKRKTDKVQIKVPGVERPMGAYVARPNDGTPRPLVFVFQEIFGVNAHIRDVTDRVADLGYVAVAIDYHHRAAPGQELGYDEASRKKAMTVIPKLTRDGFLADFDATLAWAKTQPYVKAGKFGTIGFCIGGHMAYLVAAARPVSATASFYGGGITTFEPGGGSPTVANTSQISGRILCFFGAKDTHIPKDQVEKIQMMLKQHHTKGEVVVYPEAGHGFFRDIDPKAYSASASKDAWTRVTQLFHTELA